MTGMLAGGPIGIARSRCGFGPVDCHSIAASIDFVTFKASSIKTVGEFWFRQSSKLMIEGGFSNAVALKTACFSEGQFNVGVEPLYAARGNLFLSLKPIQ